MKPSIIAVGLPKSSSFNRNLRLVVPERAVSAALKRSSPAAVVKVPLVLVMELKE
jgi:hypothetical protein